jgi:hypothetical protein
LPIGRFIEQSGKWGIGAFRIGALAHWRIGVIGGLNARCLNRFSPDESPDW